MKNLIYLFLIFMTSQACAHIIPFSSKKHSHSNTQKLSFSLAGKVTEGVTGEPVLFGDVALYKNGVLITGTQTDFDGNYIIANIPPGIYEVAASYVGFTTIRITDVAIIEGKETRLDIELSAGLTLGEVIIVEYKVPLIRVDNCVSHGTVSTAHRRNLPTRNINALAALTAGLTSKKGNKVKARGSRTSGTDYYLDGILIKDGKNIMATESTHVTTVIKPIEQSLANKLTATEVNDFADWNFWSDIQETDFIHTSLAWNMNPQNRFSIQLKNTEGFAVSGLHVELLDDAENVLWRTVSDNLGKAELYAGFESTKNEAEAKTIRISNDDVILNEIEALAFMGNTQVLTVDEVCTTSDMIELAFMMDISGSMGDEMAYLRSEITSIINQLSKQYPDKKIRAGVVYFQGHGDRNTISAHPLTDDITHLTHFIQGQYGGGGNDEAIDLALQTMVEFEWNKNSTKIAFLMGDEELNNVEENRARQRLYTKKSAEVGIKLVPIGCSGMPKSLEYVMRSMAIVTGGTYIALTDDSGIGGQHTKPTTNAIDVKSLNDIIFDVVTRYTHTTSCDFSDVVGITPMVTTPHDNLNKKYGQQNSDQHIKLFPNPTTGPFSIRKRDNKTFNEAFICDMAGRIVKQLDVDKKDFDISEFAVGTYFLLYKTNDGVYGSESLIKTGSQNSFVQN